MINWVRVLLVDRLVACLESVFKFILAPFLERSCVPITSLSELMVLGQDRFEPVLNAHQRLEQSSKSLRSLADEEHLNTGLLGRGDWEAGEEEILAPGEVRSLISVTRERIRTGAAVVVMLPALQTRVRAG